MHVLIIGAGIAGPALGAFLCRVGFTVSLCESRHGPAADEGAFLGVAPNGMSVLEALGVADAVCDAGSICLGLDFLDARGRVVGRIDTGAAVERYGSPLVLVRREDLHQTLLEVAERAGVTLHFRRRLRHIEPSEDGARALFDDGSEIVADLIVGCDGIRSTTRALVLPDAPAPVFLAQADVGGYGRADDAPLGVRRNVMVFGRRAFFGAFRREDGEVWWFQNGGPAEASTATGDEALRQRILAAHADDPSWIADVVRSTPRIHGPWLLHDIAMMPRWHSGRVCVIGDAAHACSPSAGQGASLALEDAMLLARCLRDEPAAEAFSCFELLRRDRVERIVRQSRRNGAPKVVASGVGAWLRDRLLPVFLRMGAAATHEQYAYRIDWAGGEEMRG